MHLTLAAYIQGVQDGSLDPYTVVHQHFHRAQDSDLNTFVHFHEAYMNEHLQDFGKKPLCAAPIGIKDIILTKGYTTTCCSKMMSGYIAPYSATCFTLLEQAGGLMLGKTNMDEFAMGASNETSYYGPCKNPHDPARIPGGSSGGSAAAVAAGECIAALGTDTGGSIRQPAALCGVVGLKPTYGRVSRYGVQSMTSSLDQVGVITQTVEDAQILLDAISGYDPKDMTSVERDDRHTRKDALSRGVQGLKIGVPKQYFDAGLDPKIAERIREVIGFLQSHGAIIVDVDIPLLKYGVATYYILCPAEVSSNISRFDGLRFGHQGNTDEYDSIGEYISAVRSEGLGEEVQRRILLGGYILSAGNIDQYYNKAIAVQQLLRQQIDDIYEQVDVLIGPTTPSVARKIGEGSEDPLQMYLADIYTVIANLGGYPAMSVPVGMIADEGTLMPIGCQLMSKRWNEEVLFQVGTVVENFA